MKGAFNVLEERRNIVKGESRSQLSQIASDDLERCSTLSGWTARQPSPESFVDGFSEGSA